MGRHINYIYDSAKGARRKVNKDRVYSWFVNSDWVSYFVVFDGVSSSPEALPAIAMVKKVIAQLTTEHYKYKIYNPQLIVEMANKKLLNSKYHKPYTTIALLSIPCDISMPCLACTLGDTRIYHISKQFVAQLTTDHSRAKNDIVLTKCLGVYGADPDCIVINENRDGVLALLICSDGFYKIIENYKSTLVSCCSNKSLRTAKNILKKLVFGKNDDDASYILLKVTYV